MSCGMPSEHQREKYRVKYATDDEFRESERIRHLKYYHGGYKDTVRARNMERQKQITQWRDDNEKSAR